jgi:hypothetical protein
MPEKYASPSRSEAIVDMGYAHCRDVTGRLLLL